LIGSSVKKEDWESIKPKATLAEIIFSGRDKVEFSENQVILIGPNNSCKSQSLKKAVKISLSGNSNQCLVVKDLKLNKNGNSKELLAHLKIY
jgi:predicted ATP-binding protein involved in virulence